MSVKLSTLRYDPPVELLISSIDRRQRRDNNTFCLCRTEMTSYCENLSKTLEGLRNWAQNREDDWELPEVDLTGSVAIGKAPFNSSLLMD